MLVASSQSKSFVGLPFILAALSALLIAGATIDSLSWMAEQWFTMDEYSHGVMIPFVVGYLIWQKRNRITFRSNQYNFLGVAIFIAGICMLVMMELATVYFGVLVAFLIALYGIVLSIMGLRNTLVITVPFMMLLFMIPLPNFINNNLSAELQLISSQLGVAFIRFFDISVYLEGNVIDLGSYKLQVVDACSGLRYLYPLVALGGIFMYMIKIPFWMKVIVFISTIPITVVMNSIRIGAIGVSVEYWGPEMAEGILHDIEGWFMFMASLAVVLGELWLLLKLSGHNKSLSEIFAADEAIEGQSENRFELNTPLYPIMALICVSAVVFGYLKSADKVEELVPDRLKLNHFPLYIGDWRGTPDALESVYIDALQFDDYMIANYFRGSDIINLYIAYYGSQRSGVSAHSPRSCIPGGGWQIKSLEQVNMDEIYINSQPLNTNRVVIQKGESRQVVYYWFQQRGRIITNEYLVKWYLFWDALNINRTDGALVRLTLPLAEGASLDVADQTAKEFISHFQFRMNDFIPN